ALGIKLLLEPPQHSRAAGAEHLDLDAGLLLEQIDDLLALRDRRRGVPDHFALGLGLRDIDRILRRRWNGKPDQPDERDAEIPALEHDCFLLAPKASVVVIPDAPKARSGTYVSLSRKFCTAAPLRQFPQGVLGPGSRAFRRSAG